MSAEDHPPGADALVGDGAPALDVDPPAAEVRVARSSMQLSGLAIVLSACAPEKPADSGEGVDHTPVDSGTPVETVRLATFNIEWLTADPLDGDMRRNDVDHAMITDLIEHIDADVLLLQEVEGDAAVELLGLPSHYSWETGTTGWSQNLVLVWRADRVSVTGIDELNLPSVSGASKEPLTAKVTAGALSFTVAGIHHAAFTDNESARERLEQAQDLVTWIDDTLPDVYAGEASDNVVVLGDFNDTFEGLNTSYPSLPVFEDAGFVFTTRATDSYTQISYASLIDHIALSADLSASWSEDGTPGGCHIEAHDQTSPWSDYTGGYRNTQNISDHRPVWIDLTLPR